MSQAAVEVLQVQETIQAPVLILIQIQIHPTVPVAPITATIAAKAIEVAHLLNHVHLKVVKDSSIAPQQVPRAHFPRDQIYH